MTVYVGGASSDENGNATGGEAGNQSGRELKRQAWYLDKRGWRVFRAKSVEVAAKIADDMSKAIANKRIGYDQKERNTLYKYAAPVGFDCSKVTTPCETDCSALVRVCCAYAGVKLSNFNTASEPSVLLASGKFNELTDSKYTKESEYLRAGDILVTATKGHTVIVLNDGSKAETSTPSTGGKFVFKRLLKYGSTGTDVIELKKLLIAHGYKNGITTDTKTSKNFRGATRTQVRKFQKDHSLKVDGIAGKNTITALGGVWDG